MARLAGTLPIIAFFPIINSISYYTHIIPFCQGFRRIAPAAFLPLPGQDPGSDPKKVPAEPLVLFYGDTLLYRTETSVNTLPKKDARQLLYGISVETREQAERVIEEYCS